MAPEAIQPLRIQKNAPSSSPPKHDGLSQCRPLSEIGPMERRHNSPSYNQNIKLTFNGDSSPFDLSPFVSNSPRTYWQNRDPASSNRLEPENKNPGVTRQRDSSPYPTKRSSIEDLKRASRVKNSNMFAREHRQEYDPTSTPVIERPLATGRPLSAQNSAYSGRTLGRPDTQNTRVQTSSQMPSVKHDKSEPQRSLSKDQSSPTKSSMSSRSRYAQVFDPENEIWSDDEESFVQHELPPGKSLHRHAKSVTFDAAPPQVNEYEMTTPVPSSIASDSRDGSYDSATGEDESSDQDRSMERDDSFDASLEDTEKTPVVLPEDWRFMSPDVANDDLALHVEDPFEGPGSSPAPAAVAASAVNSEPRASPSRTDSVNSNGDSRPLPPLPALGIPLIPRQPSDSSASLSATAERVSSFQRGLPSPPRPASISKAEIQGMRGCSMSLEERLRLMMIQDEETSRTANDELREKPIQQLKSDDRRDECDNIVKKPAVNLEKEVENEDVAGLGDYRLPPRISRESIMRKVKDRTQHMNNPNFDDSSPAPGFSLDQQRLSDLDPDTPLPSLEGKLGQLTLEENEETVVIKQETDEIDVYDIPDLYGHYMQVESRLLSKEVQQVIGIQGTRVANGIQDDDASHYSDDSRTDEIQEPASHSATEDEGPPTPKPVSPRLAIHASDSKVGDPMSLPRFTHMLGERNFDFGIESYLTPSPPTTQEHGKSDERFTVVNAQPEMDQPVTPEEQLQPPRFPGHNYDSDDEPKTPESVIRHPVHSPPKLESPVPESPGVPERIATIKAPGGRLKTRPSATPADIQAMAETRRLLSAEQHMRPLVPERHKGRPSVTIEVDENASDIGSETGSLIRESGDKQPKRKSSLVPLDIPISGSDGLGFGLDKEFDRVIEVQKVAFTPSSPDKVLPLSCSRGVVYIAGFGYIADRFIRTQKGYLMRQNTKVVVARSASDETVSDDVHGTRTRAVKSAGSSPRKVSQSQTWTTEPWNGKIRRKSVKHTGSSPSKTASSGPAPPLPGQLSNVTSDLEPVVEDTTAPTVDETQEGGERGRLFVKVVGVKDLDLPLPRGERSYFALTLDNGLHCVTTAWLELGKSAPIGQEFELVVLNDLEFQLTLQTKLEEPKPRPAPQSPTKSIKTPKPSTFSRVFASPKKRKELELRQQEEAQREARQRQQDAQESKRFAQPTAWDLLNGLVAKDGSFGRSYICLKDHEKKAFGKPYSVDVPCFNEWATEKVQTTSSIKSKRSTVNGDVQRRAPYRIGKLELQLFYVPKPRGANDEDMPKSMNACIRELQEAKLATAKAWEGHLSQQGGDCPYWRRRFFTLDGSKLTAYHEATRQPRATINLAKASKLIDDKTSLIQKETSGKSGSRRKSAFAEEEEGYMFVEEGFRIRFANGETIDFYADSAAEKEGWMRVLIDVVGKDALARPKGWTDLVLSTIADKSVQIQPNQSKMPPARSAPTTPARKSSQHQKNVPQQPYPAPPPVDKSPRHQGPRSSNTKTRSMVF